MAKTVIKHLFNIDQHIELYAEIINENLQCPPEVRESYIKTLRKEMKRYIRKHPDALMGDICRRFGDPYDQREGVFKIIQKMHERQMRKRSLLFIAITTVLVVLLVVSIGIMLYYSSNSNEYLHYSNIGCEIMKGVL